MITSEDLKDIFYSGFDGACNWVALDELEILIQEEAINYDREKISSKNEYLKVIDNIKVIDGLGPQGKGHMALKEITKDYLEKLNKKVFLNFILPDFTPMWLVVIKK